jgi:hypothetical protein
MLHSVGKGAMSVQLPSPYGKQGVKEHTTNIALGVHHTLDTLTHFLAWAGGTIEKFLQEEEKLKPPLTRKGSSRKTTERKASMLANKVLLPSQLFQFIQYEAKRKDLKAVKVIVEQLCTGANPTPLSNKASSAGTTRCCCCCCC